MARVDKTESAIGVLRGTLAADFVEADFDTVVGVGLDSSGLVVAGAGQSGIIGVVIPDRTAYKAGTRCDVFTLAEILFEPGEQLVGAVDTAAGTVMYAVDASGVVTATGTGATVIGYTVEADRLVIRK